jgi:trehalose/maltose hydrolase-like predicted phosphorylase
MELFEITYDGWNAGEQKLREALCTLGNGYFATRGAAEESSNDEFNYPGTYIAGGFNRAKSEVSGRVIENEDFVNFPNWLCLSFRATGGEWLDLNRFTLHIYRQILDMKSGMLIREFRVEDPAGRLTSVKSRRFVSMSDMHLAGLEWEFIPENWSGTVEIRSALDGRVVNAGVDRYKELESLHLDAVSTAINGDDSMVLLVQTRHSRLSVALAASTRVYHSDKIMDLKRESTQHEKYVEQVIHLDAAEGQTYVIEKIAALYTSRDRATSEPSIEASRSINRAARFMEILDHHKHSWKRLWRRADIEISGKKQNQQLLRLHIFHILQTVSPNTVGLDAGVPARGLHGEAYRGHIFWDELYILPFLNLSFPEITRSLLMYRYFRLDEARHAAKQEGFRGAMFPWQSGSNGREETQILHLNPRSGRWIPDNTHLQRHVNAAIVYNVWKYYQATHDNHFFSGFGAEMILSIAFFWASAAGYNEKRGRYEIHGVVGPDEYHTTYPGSEEQGLRNNAYTNVMVAWVCRKALDTLVILDQTRRNEILEELGIGNDVIRMWDEISRRMYVPVGENGIIEQFEGYEMLTEFPWEEYREKYGDISRLDRILENEGKSTDSYKAGKQADVLMLLYLFPEEELSGIFRNLGYNLSHQMILRNIAYYSKRTSHGSTLSRLVFSSVLSRYDRTTSWQNFQKLLVSDFEDIQGGTTPEGIHLGAMAGSLDLVQKTYAGVEIREDVLWIKPDLPENIGSVKIRVNYRLHWIFISIDRQNINISFEEGLDKKVKIGVIDRIYTLRHGETKKFPFSNPSDAQLKQEQNENSNTYSQPRSR